MANKEYAHTFISKRGSLITTCNVCGITKQMGSSQRVPPVCYVVPIEDAPVSEVAS